MKTLTCDLCDHTVSGETFEAWMENLKPHYMSAHADFMEQNAHGDMQKWMDDNRARFDAQDESFALLPFSIAFGAAFGVVAGVLIGSVTDTIAFSVALGVSFGAGIGIVASLVYKALHSKD